MKNQIALILINHIVKCFNEAINNEFTINELNKCYAYHFILLHYKNKKYNKLF